MIKSLKSNKTFDLKTKIVNTLMISGKKKTGEKVLLKFAKLLQKSTNKNFKSLVQLAIVNSTPTFKLNEQILKKGKRKAIKSTPSFITSDSLRIMTSLKFIRNAVAKNKSSVYFYESLVNEIMASSALKSQAVDKKNELQKQILINKRYLSKFRW
jgi:ribosomal protein S7